METISTDCLQIIANFLTVREYKNINKWFNELAKNNASFIISRYLKKWQLDSAYVEVRMDRFLNEYFADTNTEILLRSNAVNVVYDYYKKSLAITKRSFNTTNILIDEHAAYVADYVLAYVNISKVRVEYDMSEVYEIDRDLQALQKKLHVLKLEQKRDTDIETSSIENMFIDKLVLCNFSIESAVSYTENEIYMRTIEYLADRKIRLNTFCDEYITYCLLGEIMEGLEESLKSRLRAVAYNSVVARNNKSGIDFNRIVQIVEPEVLITTYLHL